MKNKLFALLPHAVAVILFIVIASTFFSLVGNDYTLRQSDIQHVMGMSKEIQDYRLMNNDEEPLWSNNMFGGMPAYQTTVLYKSNLLRPIDALLKFYLPAPVGALFMCMLGFYILMLCLRVNPWLGIVGAVSFGLSTINILYLGAGHTSKINAIGYMAPALGGLLLAFRGRALLGGGLFALAFGLHLASNHLQMTYYLAWLLAAVALTEFIYLVYSKQLKSALQASAILAVAAVLGILPNAGNLLTTYEYSKLTTRGQSELTILPEGFDKDRAQQQDGLSDSYILDYNMAPGEPWSLVIPNAKGGSSMVSLGADKEALRLADKSVREQLMSFPQYWGAQGASAGAFYFGAAMMFLFALAFIFGKDRLRWPFLALSLLALALCMQNMHAINHFFINSFPMYNKFRDSKMILVLIQIMAPALGILFLNRLLNEGVTTQARKFLLIGAGASIAIIALLNINPKITGPLISEKETEYLDNLRDQYGDDKQTILLIGDMEDSIETVRTYIFREDAKRSLFIIVLAAGVLVAVAFNKIKWFVAAPVMLLIVTVDMWTISSRYMNEEKGSAQQGQKPDYIHYAKIDDMVVPYVADKCDLEILKMEKSSVPNFDAEADRLEAALKSRKPWSQVKNKERIRNAAEFGVLGLNTNYRVLLASGGVFSDAQTAYYHKSLGGYHAAKLKRYQEIIDFYLSPEINAIGKALQTGSVIAVDSTLRSSPVLNMLNTRYIKYSPNAAPIDNSKNALGNAWFVSEIQQVTTADEEMLAIKNIAPEKTAVVDDEFATIAKSPTSVDTMATIVMTKYATKKFMYHSESSVEAPAIFSEIYYPKGWVCRIDGNEVPTFRANYILRGAMIPAGTHDIEWSFEPDSYQKTNTINWTGSILLLLFVIGAFVWSIIKGNKQEEAVVLDRE